MLPIYEDIPFQIWFIDTIPEQYYTPTDYLLFFLVKGSVHVKISEEVYDFRENELFLVHPGEAYKIFDSQSYLLCTVRMSFGFILRCCDYERPSFTSSKHGHRLMGTARIFDKIEELAHAFFSCPRPSVSRLTYLFYDFAYFFIENYKADDGHEDTVARRIYQIRDFIETSFHMPITLNALADALHITPQYLSAFIKKQLGITFGTYLNKVRLNHAAYDLAHTTENVTQIMYKNGFPNATGFHQSFKKCYGLSPLEYRRCIWEENNGQKPQPPDNQFSQMACRLYKDFVTLREKKHQGRKGTHSLNVDANDSSYLQHPWCSVLNLGNILNILNIDYYAQIQLITTHISFKYARIICREQMPSQKELALFDSVLDALKRLGLTPWIVLGGACNDNESRGAADLTKQLLKHGSDRYGYSYISEWMLEYAINPEQTPAQYMECFRALFLAAKNTCRELRVGGPSCRLDFFIDREADFLEKCQEMCCVPDFISLATRPYNSQSRQLSSVSTDERRLYTIASKTSLPIAIVESGLIQHGSSYLNDTLFMGDFLLKNSLALGKYAAYIASPPLSDLGESNQTFDGTLLCGGRGILSASSLLKPTFFALKYLSQLGSQCIHRGENHCITMRANGELVILLYNYKQPDFAFCHQSVPEIELNKISELFPDKTPATFQLTIRNLPYGKYQVTKFLLNESHGSILDCWLSFGAIQNIRHDALNYLRGTLWPKMSVYEAENDKGLILNETLEAHEIIMLDISPWEH